MYLLVLASLLCLVAIRYVIAVDVFVLSDICNEPDDTESLIRLLLYSNEITIKGLVATTSTWQNSTVRPDEMLTVIDGYEKVVENLNHHRSGYPSADYLRSIVNSGPDVYGLSALSQVKANESSTISEGSRALLKAVDETAFGEKLFIQCWGGANTLAQVLHYVSKSRSTEEIKTFTSKISVYAISDQDDSGLWIREKFPEIRYIASVHGFNMYSQAAWVGISGETFYGFDKGGPDTSLVSHEWVKKNVQIGPLGSLYPDFAFIMEGDTPAFLSVIPNGLNIPEHPEYGGWGGRYALTDTSGRSNHYSDVPDAIIGLDGTLHRSSQATIWRWREAYQNDFAARIQWTLSSDFESANHEPHVVLNGTTGSTIYEIEPAAGNSIYLDASQSYDDDKSDTLEYRWYQYKEISAIQSLTEYEVPTTPITDISKDGSIVRVDIPGPEQSCINWATREVIEQCKYYHLILEVIDNGKPRLRSYRRILVKPINKALEPLHDEL
ncbi:hypothetical protein V1511DRAFT_190554 [Dipodascopsis uninucleata]